ncbi:MBL fold metallo-hydrolase [Caldivirga maquilingensis]|uniref:UPF0282 protein Cmaq_0751 n=1 Tax=Caldivirga maquilingensis (strain ATCC 700844 / DSM 13496 / JCM 10307 / IC-167) TaxID=397948 RepID=A8MCT1_CALMQ|nr:MBL fold metallo-hydrolase [Caldivirga maquilingensis]ABW01587.1 conserved hypothetical protein [Caldivirga maquilingensis IC-167]
MVILIRPLGEESLGIRSMSLYVETRGLRILIDPGASLAPFRFGLPPHPREFDALKAFRERLMDLVDKVDYIFISHYHRDHFTPPYSSVYMGTGAKDYELIYGGKVVLAKDYETVNPSQRRRGIGLFKAVQGLVSKWVKCDGQVIDINGTRLIISNPIPHGKPGSKTGYVVGLGIIDESGSLAYIPDVQGPLSREAVEFALSLKAEILVIGGFPVYLLGNSFKQEDLNEANNNLITIWNMAKPKKLILAHHLLRIINWRNYIPSIIEAHTYASILGLNDNLLEARRRELYEIEDPGRGYVNKFKRRSNREE